MSIRLGTAEHLGVRSSDVQKFYAENWDRKIALSNDDFYIWQFVDLPRNEKVDSCHLAFDDETEKIVGVMGLNKRPFNLRDKVVQGAELTTWIVNQNFQGTGIGAKILLDIKRNYDVLIGMNISDAAVPIYLRSGFRFIRQIPRFFRVYNSERVEKISEFTPLARKMIQIWGNQRTEDFIDSAPEASDIEYIDLKMKLTTNHFSRSQEFLTWRYDSHPFFGYVSRIIKSPKYLDKKLLVVYRIEDTSSGVKVLHVMDLLGDVELIPTSISYINSVAIANSIDLADFYCTFPDVLDYFLSHGWFSAMDDYYIKVPNLFQPAELRTPQTSSMIIWGNENAQEVYDTSRMYVTKQDCDLDRPTAHYLERNLELGRGL